MIHGSTFLKYSLDALGSGLMVFELGCQLAGHTETI